jgi:hypothetical protein
MTQKEKAKELVSKYIHLAKQTSGANGTLYNSKQCALIAVDELIYSHSQDTTDNQFYYWQQVKKEINGI